MSDIATLPTVVKERFPGLRVAFLTATAPPRYTSSQKTKVEQDIVRTVTDFHHSAERANVQELADRYRGFYQTMGLKAARVTTPIQQSMRILETQRYRSLFPVLDVCMEIEYTTLMSFQLFDLDKLAPPVMYDLATGDEGLVTLGGETKLCKPGELILRDGRGVINSTYYANARTAAVDDDSRRVLVRILGVPGAGEQFDEAVQRTEDALELSQPPLILAA